MQSSSVVYSFFSLVFFLLAIGCNAGGAIGVNYGRIADNLPPPEKVVELLKSQGINRVKLYDTDSSVLKALTNSNISVVVALPNELLSSAASDQDSFVDNWMKSNIVPYHPRIEAIAVGNEVFVDPGNTTGFLVPAMKNMYASLVKLNLSQIKLSSPIALSSLNQSYPPSAGVFQPDLIPIAIKPMLEFLSQTESYLMVNAYPFFSYSANPKEVSLDYALLNPNDGVLDPSNGLTYYTLLEAQLDAVYAAISAVGFNNIDVVVTETGWPSQGDEDEIGASAANAAAYNGNLIRRVSTDKGTPLKPQVPLNVYLFALFNEDQKPGPTSERHYGLFYPSEEKVYDVSLASARVENASGMLDGLSKATVGSQTWCVANESADEYDLQVALDYACGEGGADCRPIQDGAACHDPDTVVAHASYAFNSYYQKNHRRAGSCFFGRTAHVVSQSPRYQNCVYPTGY